MNDIYLLSILPNIVILFDIHTWLQPTKVHSSVMYMNGASEVRIHFFKKEKMYKKY